MAKFEKQFEFVFFGMTFLHAHAQYIYIVNVHFKKLLFCQKTFFWHQTSLCKCSLSLYCVGKVLNCFGTSCGTS